jgi:SAM-dependent methyltransferase
LQELFLSDQGPSERQEDLADFYREAILLHSLAKGPEQLPKNFFKVASSVPSWHLKMLQDRERLDFYHKLIQAKVRDKIVLDIGTGTGILTHLALISGAKKVYSVEVNPVMQVLFKGLMQERIKSGEVELLSLNALDLKLATFGTDRPQVILHEIFGADGLNENLLPVFQHLKAENILKPEVELIPDLLEMWVEPVWSEIHQQATQVESYAGYPLDKLKIFGHQKFFQTDYRYSQFSNWQITGAEQRLFACPIHDTTVAEQVELVFNPGRCSHLRLWMKLTDTASGLCLESHHGRTNSHWVNYYLPVPHWLRSQSFQVGFKIGPKHIQVLQFGKID